MDGDSESDFRLRETFMQLFYTKVSILYTMTGTTHNVLYCGRGRYHKDHHCFKKTAMEKIGWLIMLLVTVITIMLLVTY